MEHSQNSSIVASFRITFSNELSNLEVFLLEPFQPTSEILMLFIIQVLQVIQRPMQVFREHFLIEALTCEPARGIPTGKILIWATLERIGGLKTKGKQTKHAIGSLTGP